MRVLTQAPFSGTLALSSIKDTKEEVMAFLYELKLVIWAEPVLAIFFELILAISTGPEQFYTGRDPLAEFLC